MGKLSALLVGTFLLLVLAYSELASGFTPLINWLGPILGIPLQFLLGLIFMMIGNPLAYPSVLIDWVALGVVIGLIVRRTGGAVLSAFLVYVVGWVFLVATGGIVFYHVFPRGVLSSLSTLSAGVSVPPPPPGTDIATILNEPLLNGLPSLFASATSAGGALNSITADWESVLLSSLGNFFILLFIAGLAGFVTGRVSNKLKTVIVRRKFQAGLLGGPPKAKALLATMLILFMIVSTSSTFISAALIPLGEDGYGSTSSTFISAAQTSTSSPSATCISSQNLNQNPQEDLAYGIAQPNLWNTLSSQGSVTLCYGPLSGLSASVALSDIQLEHSNTPVGYPEAAYGYSYNGTQFGTQDQSLLFPMQISSLSYIDLWSNVTYSISNTHPSQLDFGYDLWVEGQPQGAPSSTDFELLILFTDSFDYTQSPPQNQYSNEISIDSQLTPVTWQVYTAIPGGTKAKLIIFSLPISNQLLSGTVAIKPYDFISYVATDLTTTPLANYWLRGIEVGTEFLGQPQSEASMNWAISSFSLSADSKTVYIIPPQLVGVRNSIDISNSSISSSSACPQGLNQPHTCFSLQQNFFVASPFQGSPLYWVQNTVVIGTDTSGNYWVLSAFNIWNGARTTLEACNGVPIRQTTWTCYTANRYKKIESPLTINLASVVSGGKILMTVSANGASVSTVQCPGSLNCLLFPTLPLASYVSTTQTNSQSYAPELDVVGPPTGGHVSFSSGADLVVSSFVELAGETWSTSVIQYPTFANWTLESSSGLQWSCAGINSASFLYNQAGTDEGVGYEPAPSGQLSVTCVTPSTGTGYGNTFVNIWGTGFDGAMAVDFGPDNPSTNYRVVNDSDIQAFSPPGTGTVNVTVTTPLGTSMATSADEFSYVTVSGFSPVSGPESGGTLITITGNGFENPAHVWFGNTESSSVNVLSPTTITAVSPPGTGSVPIIVEVGALGNIPIQGNNEFTYGTNVSPPFYLESILGEINPDGSATSFYSFLTNSATQSRLFNLTSDEAFMLLFSQSGGLSLLPSSLSSSFSNYASFVPQTMAFLAYAGDCADSQTQANTAARSLGAAIKAPDLNLILSFPLYSIGTGTGPGQQGCGFVYGSGTPLSTVGPVVASDVLPSISQTGLINILGDGLTSGHLIPGETPTSVNATVLVVGFGSASALSSSLQFILPYSETSIPSPTGLIGFAGAVTLSQGVVHSSPITHDVSLGQLLDYQRAISFANSSTLSVAGLGVPPPGSLSSSWNDLAPTDQLVLYTNNPSVSSSLGPQSSTRLLYSGQSIPASSIHVSFTGLFPADLRVSKSLAQGDNGNVVVSIKVRNLDTSSVTLVSEDDSAFLNSYSGGAILVSGESTNSSSMVLNPNSVITYQYTVHLSGIGSYYSTPAIVTYLLNGTSFAAESNAVVWQQAPPPAPVAIFELLGSIAGLINNDLGTSQSSPVTGSVIVYMPILLLVGLAVLSEYRSFRNWGRINPETARKLEELKRMLDSGLITEKEYEEQRRRLSTPR